MFHIRVSTRKDFPRMTEIINSQITEPVSLDDMLRGEEARNKENPFLRVVAVTESGDIAGYGVTHHESGNHPGEWFMRIRVDQRYQRHGIGNALYEHLLAFACERGATSFESSIREQDTQYHGWVERLGFVTEYHLFESTLSLPDWDPTPFLGAVEKAKAQGFRFSTLAQETVGMEQIDAYRRYYAFFLPIVHDIPGNEDRPRMPFDEWYPFVKDDPEWRPEHVLLAVDAEGTWAAVAHLKKTASGALYNDFTGVARDFRSKGLTLAIKVEALCFAKTLGAPYIRTNNLSVNPRILAVNKRLGYVPVPGHFMLKKRMC